MMEWENKLYQILLKEQEADHPQAEGILRPLL